MSVVRKVSRWLAAAVIALATSTFVASPVGADEDQRPAIGRLYNAAFDRSADAAGLEYWHGLHAEGVSLNAISEYFTTSAEFHLRYGSVDNEEFVNLVYLNVLDRGPDPAGLAYWVEVLGAGYSRGVLLNGFAQSTEFIEKTETEPVRLLLIGDSIFHGIRLLGLPIGDAEVRYMTEEGRQPSALPALLDIAAEDGSLASADVIVIHLGTNGWVDSYRAMFQTEIDSIGNTPVILVNTEVDRPWEEAANTDIENLAAAKEGVALADWNGAAAQVGLMRADGVHPTTQGLEVLAGLVNEQVVEILRPG